MARFLSFSVHRPWEDWVSGVLGLAVIASPILAPFQLVQITMLNTLIVGILLLGLAVFEIMLAGRWEEILEFALGVWLALSSFILDYAQAGNLRVWHFVLGAIVAVLAAVEFWQDSATGGHKPAGNA
jgi:hypothetical protein